MQDRGSGGCVPGGQGSQGPQARGSTLSREFICLQLLYIEPVRLYHALNSIAVHYYHTPRSLCVCSVCVLMCHSPSQENYKDVFEALLVYLDSFDTMQTFNVNASACFIVVFEVRHWILVLPLFLPLCQLLLPDN